nr:FG-GAP-like repeat-containing protein [Actinomycetota bacterium]
VRATSSSGEAPRDLELSVIDPGTSPADDDAATVTSPVDTASGRSAATYVSRSATTVRTLAVRAASNPRGVRAPRPRIRSRRAWGANERLRSGSPSYGTVKAGFVHHTVSQNRYTKRKVPSIIRGIYAYHTQSLNWSDIGYNFLVDRFGRIWQGRAGDLSRNVIGAHTYGYNHVAFAMSAIGNFETKEPPRAMLRAYGKLMGWRLGKWGIAAGDRSRYLEGKRFHAINGHRDAGSTACPGKYLYARLPRIRRLARNWQRYGTLTAPDGGGEQPPPEDNNPPPPPEEEPPPPEEETPRPPREPDRLRDLQSDGFPDLLVRDRATSRLQVLVGDGGPGFARRDTVNDNVGGAMLFTGVGDVTGDDRDDLLVRNGRTKIAKVRPGRRSGGFGRPIAPTRRFAGADLIAGVGNMVGTRRPDVVARDAETGRVWLYRGRAGGRWGRKHVLIRDGRRLSLLGRAGDLDRNGTRDLVARSGRRLMLYPGRRSGRVGAPLVIARGWAGKDLTAGGYDVTGDGELDIVARDRSTGRTWIYLTNRKGRIKGRFGGWRSWRDLDRLTGVGDVTGDGEADILGRSSERLVVFPSLGTRWLQGPLDTGRVAGNANFLQVVGDWNDDGHPDVVARSARTGIVRLYRGTGGQDLRAGVVLARHWRHRTFLVGPGDLSGDGLPDLLSRDQDGVVWLHPSNGRIGMKQRTVARQRIFRTDLVAAAGRWNDDRTRDVIVRKARTKELYLLPGTREGTLGRAVLLPGGRHFGDYDKILGVGDFNGDRRPDILARESQRGRLWLFAGSASGLREREYVASGMDRFDLLG